MNKPKRDYLATKVRFLAVALLLFAATDTKAGPPNKPNVDCKKVGEELKFGRDWSPGGDDYVKKCCPGLSSVSHPIDCDDGAAPGKIICAPCGDGKCDGNFENKCNCPKDCTNSSKPKPTEACETPYVCKLEDLTFKFLMRSVSGDCTEDDTVFLLKTDNKSMEMGLPKGWHGHLSNLGNSKGICQMEADRKNLNVPVYAVGKNQILLFFWTSGRPRYDWLSMALIDVKSGKVLDSRMKFAELKDATIPILKTGGAFKLRVIKEHLKEIPCDCPTAAIEHWVEVSVRNSKIKTVWM